MRVAQDQEDHAAPMPLFPGKWIRLAAENGSVKGQIWLGNHYENGSVVPKDLTEAMKWYRTAADRGAATGQIHVGKMYAQTS